MKKRLTAIIATLLMGGLLMASPASSVNPGPLSLVPIGGKMSMFASFEESLGLRVHEGPVMYGLELNKDIAKRYPQNCGLERGVVEWGRTCQLTIGLVNDTGQAISTSSDQDQHWMQENAGWQSWSNSTWSEISDSHGDGTTWHPGEERVWRYSRTYAMEPGTYTDRFRVVVGGTLLDEFYYTYELQARPASPPSGGLVQFTRNTLSVGWTASPHDGGANLTGHLVYLVPDHCSNGEPCPDYPSEWRENSNDHPWIPACDFTGRPELRICDVPNNYLTRVEPGTYRFAVMPMSTAFSQPFTDHGTYGSANLYQWWSDEFTVENTLGLPPPPEPEPEPEPEPTPVPDVIVVVADYSNAPNLASLIHATNYSNDLDAPVLRLYQAYFNRPPDLLGIKYWLDVRRSGYSQFAIAGFMAGSREFANNYEGVSDSEYLTRVYQNMLGRQYDQAGFNYWLDILRGTNEFGLNPTSADLSRAEVVYYVTGGQEFINNYPYTN